jgi:Putative Zn-dependent protease, contains TPR repeats
MGTRKTAKSGHQHSEQFLLRQQLKVEPHHHWILTRLSSVYYEQRRYALALKYAEKAFAEVPSCPLVLWDYAGTLQMLGRHNEALDLYARVVTRGVDRIANGECGEGRAWARGLISDSHYRASLSLKAIGNERASSSAFEQCLDLRGPGCRSIYRLNELGTSDVTSTRPPKKLLSATTKKRRVKGPRRSRG